MSQRHEDAQLLEITDRAAAIATVQRLVGRLTNRDIDEELLVGGQAVLRLLEDRLFIDILSGEIHDDASAVKIPARRRAPACRSSQAKARSPRASGSVR